MNAFAFGKGELENIYTGAGKRVAAWSINSGVRVLECKVDGEVSARWAKETLVRV